MLLCVTVCRVMSSGVFALFGTHSSDTHDVISSYTDKLNMPYITSSMAVPGGEEGYQVGGKYWLLTSPHMNIIFCH